MKIAELEITGIDAKKKLIQFIEKMYHGGHAISMDNSYVYFYEDFSSRNSSAYTLNFVIFEYGVSKVKLHIVGGGSGTGILNIDWGKTSSEIKHFYKKLVKVGKQNSFEVNELSIVKKSMYY
jgi:hypothetical protein